MITNTYSKKTIYILSAGLLTILVFACLISLGTWQYHRLQWKEGLLATIQERTEAKPVSLEKVERLYRETNDVDYWPVKVWGRFEHEREQYFFSTYKGKSGYNVYTPLRIDDERVILVNRGFVPFDYKSPLKRLNGQVQGRVMIVGLARNPLVKKPHVFIPDNKDIFYWKDHIGMAKAAGLAIDGKLLPFFIDTNESGNLPGLLPIGGVTIINLPNNHLQYAITWYGLALALLCVSVTWIFRQLRQD